MKRLTLALSTLLLTAQAALAAEPSGPPLGGPRGGPPIEQIARDLNLDDTQKAEVKRIFDEQRAKREAAREQFRASGERPSPETMRAQMQQDELDLLQQLSGVLNTEQLQKFKQMQEKRRQRMRQRMQDGMHDGPPPAPSGQ
jgi:Spy/CpxP family protein refolding chaperone